jgi:tetratricopeptide (TPR) repeat protein/O-antigen ligase
VPTKLSRYAEGIMEAAWLAAVILVPAFFNVYSSRIFEPDKITLLRSLSLFILGAWIVKLVEEGGMRWDHLPREASWWKSLLKTPLLIPVVGLAIVYIIATIFSITPRVSLWGSYQRLQGTYTTFAYLVIFAALAGNLRRRSQVSRLITTVILTSLPISLYGVLQRYHIDPVPWGGDVTRRIAANMGNSIFVAAYLIMVNPLTLVRIFESFGAILKEEKGLLIHIARGTAYVFIAALQLIALFFSGSRGPWLGWMAGSFFLFIVLSLLWRKRWMTLSVIGVALLAGGFLLLLNIPNGPLASLRSLPGVGRLGELLDAESRTGRVRTLIWQGAEELVLPHKPLEYPDGSKDKLNFLRPLIGYGPESMYVAYNPFYQPELTQVEKRNASPDRSHNETWDSLVITGLLGLIVYLTLFASIFYFGSKWLGLVNNPGQRNLFLGLFIGGGILGAVVFVIWQGPAYFGVGLPFGTLIGLLVYLTWSALFGHYETPSTESDQQRALVLIGLLAVVVAHYVEINFGIAIAATRTYFWSFTGLLILVGYILPLHGEYEAKAESTTSPAPVKSQEKSSRKSRSSFSDTSRRKKHRTGRTKAQAGEGTWKDWQREALIGGFIVTIVMATLGYDFLANPFGARSAVTILWNSLVRLRGSNSPISYGVLAMFFTSWLVAGVLLASENGERQDRGVWLKKIAGILGISLSLGLIYWLIHAGGIDALLQPTANTLDGVLTQLGRYESLLTRFYIFIFMMIFAGALVLPEEWPIKSPGTHWQGATLAPVMLGAVFFLVSFTNLRVIQADIAFKAADPYTKQQNGWPVAIAIYNHANQLAPSEDYYYLFLGRAYLEQGQSLTNADEREKLFTQAMKDLEKAQALNPLNIDHTANLARLNSLWAAYTTDPQLKAERSQASSDYFARAVVLAPNNARLWDEWALLFMNTLKKPDQAYQRLTHSLEIDPYYDWTYALLGDYNVQQAQTAQAADEKKKDFQQAVDEYTQALKLVSASDTSSQYKYSYALGTVYIQLNEYAPAATAFQQAIQANPNNTDIWRIEETLTRLYYQMGDPDTALIHANKALSAAPDNQKDSIRTLITQIKPSSQP